MRGRARGKGRGNSRRRGRGRDQKRGRRRPRRIRRRRARERGRGEGDGEGEQEGGEEQGKGGSGEREAGGEVRSELAVKRIEGTTERMSWCKVRENKVYAQNPPVSTADHFSSSMHEKSMYRGIYQHTSSHVLLPSPSLSLS